MVFTRPEMMKLLNEVNTPPFLIDASLRETVNRKWNRIEKLIS